MHSILYYRKKPNEHFKFVNIYNHLTIYKKIQSKKFFAYNIFTYLLILKSRTICDVSY
jgi:hypothetical protein